MSQCGKNDHCCWFDGKRCQFLVTSQHPDFDYSCILRTMYGSWEEVHKSEEYLEVAKLDLKKAGYKIDCGDWPPDGVACHTCGKNVDNDNPSHP